MKEQNYLDSLVGVFGHPASENPGVVIQEAAFKDLGLDLWRFLTIDVKPEDLGDAIKGLRAFNMRGINTTLPHKIEILKYLDDIEESAKHIGAVNTIVNENNKLTGYNTDGKGFMIAIEEAGISPKDKNIVILGAGGAARAISVEMSLAGAKKITVVNRPEDKVLGDSLYKVLKEELKMDVEYVIWDKTYDVPKGTEILVNATPVGLYPNVDQKPNINYETMTSDIYVQDVIPNPAFTPFLKEAKDRGCKWQSGMSMLVNQAALNIEMWTGLTPNKKVMIEAFEKVVG
jgi:shikimate dehydrogenase